MFKSAVCHVTRYLNGTRVSFSFRPVNFPAYAVFPWHASHHIVVGTALESDVITIGRILYKTDISIGSHTS
jgi:hypothetical protein